MAAHWSDRLSAYLDGELTADERRRADEHLQECAPCREDLDVLRRIQAAARAPAEAPSSDPWPAIAAVLAAERPAGRGRWRWAAVLLPAVAAGAVWWAMASGGATPEPSGGSATGGGALSRQAESLERQFVAMTPELNPRTVQTVQASLQSLDAALARIEAALVDDGDNALLLALAERVRRQKLRVLRDALRS